MLPQRDPLCKSSPARFTLEWFFPRVHSGVFGQIPFSGELFAAPGEGTSKLFYMLSLMQVKLLVLGKFLLAFLETMRYGFMKVFK